MSNKPYDHHGDDTQSKYPQHDSDNLPCTPGINQDPAQAWEPVKKQGCLDIFRIFICELFRITIEIFNEQEFFGRD